MSVAPEPFDSEYPPALQRREAELLGMGELEKPTLGVGLSGGGIRSATLCLGIFQGLAKKPSGLPRIHYLSTVSGGGYFGAFYCRLFNREYIKEVQDVARVLKEERISHAKAPQRGDVLRWLRKNSRYLAPGGAGDLVLGGAVLLRNWLSLMLCVLSVVMLGFLGEYVLRAALDERMRVVGAWLFDVVVGTCSLLRPESAAAHAFRINEFLDHVPAHVLAGPWVWFAAGVLLFLVLPSMWAYWMIPLSATRSTRWASVSAVVLPLVAFGTSHWFPSAYLLRYMSVAAAVAGTIACLFGLAIWWGWPTLCEKLHGDGSRDEKKPKSEDATRMRSIYARHGISVFLKYGLLMFGGAVVLTLLDWGAVQCYELVLEENLWDWLAWAWAALFTAGGTASANAKKIAVWANKRPDDVKLRPKTRVASGIAGVIVGAVVVISLRVATVGIASNFATTPGDLQLDAVLPAFVMFAVLSLLFGLAWSFVNRSSYLPLYSARLARTYLGASNSTRHESKRSSVIHVVPGDDVPMSEYWTYRSEKPLHLLNVTVNDTMDAGTELLHRDRKGVGMAVGPAGLSLGRRYHAVFQRSEGAETRDGGGESVKVFGRRGSFVAFGTEKERKNRRMEMPDLGCWMGISGAAFSTGLGWRTSRGLSLLTGLANVRLGYWWDSGVQRRGFFNRLRTCLPVHVHLLDELTARFPGAARRWWYLSDGGHFENLGGYELIRRKLKFIVLVDAEADPDYRFEGLSNLLHKARVDFGATIELESLDLLRPTDDEKLAPFPTSQRQYLRGTIRYDDGTPSSHLIYVKASMTGKEPLDVLRYKGEHPAFPHQGTHDQFFDERQWESYRCLGEHIGKRLPAWDEAPPIGPDLVVGGADALAVDAVIWPHPDLLGNIDEAR